MVPGPSQRSVEGALGGNGAAAASKTQEKKVLQLPRNPQKVPMPAEILQPAAGQAGEAAQVQLPPWPGPAGG